MNCYQQRGQLVVHFIVTALGDRWFRIILWQYRTGFVLDRATIWSLKLLEVGRTFMSVENHWAIISLPRCAPDKPVLLGSTRRVE